MSTDRGRSQGFELAMPCLQSSFYYTVSSTTSVEDCKPAIHPCSPPRNRIKADELPSIDPLESWQWSHASRHGFVNPHKLRRLIISPLDYLTCLTCLTPSATFRSMEQEKPGEMSSDRCAAGVLSFPHAGEHAETRGGFCGGGCSSLVLGLLGVGYKQ